MKKKNDGITKALIFVAIALVVFVISMEVMFYICGSVPDSLIAGVLGCGGTECIGCVFLYLFKKKWGAGED